MSVPAIFKAMSMGSDCLTVSHLENVFGSDDPAKIQAVFGILDENGDGEVSVDEFSKAMVQQPQLLKGLSDILNLPTTQMRQSDVRRQSDVSFEEEIVDDHDQDHDENADEEDRIRNHTVKQLESEVKEFEITVQALNDSLQEEYEVHASDVADLESQLSEAETLIQTLRKENHRFSEAAKTEKEAREQGKAVDIFFDRQIEEEKPTHVTHGHEIEEMLGSVRGERDDLHQRVEELETTIAKLNLEQDNEKRSFFSKKRVSETTLQLLQGENGTLREQLSELDHMKAHNEELQDLLDEQHQTNSKQIVQQHHQRQRRQPWGQRRVCSSPHISIE